MTKRQKREYVKEKLERLLKLEARLHHVDIENELYGKYVRESDAIRREIIELASE